MSHTGILNYVTMQYEMLQAQNKTKDTHLKRAMETISRNKIQIDEFAAQLKVRTVLVISPYFCFAMQEIKEILLLLLWICP